MESHVGCTLEYEVPRPTAFVSLVEATRLERRLVRDGRLRLSPEPPQERSTAPESGDRSPGVQAAPGQLRLDHEATVAPPPRVHDPADVREMPGERLPLPALLDLDPSRHREADRLSPFARRTFGHLAPGHARVGAVCDWICENVDYAPGSTDESTSAADILVERRGVCWDFVHPGIAPVRALGVPARYVAAYARLLDAQDLRRGVRGLRKAGGWRRTGSCASAWGATRATPRPARRSGGWGSNRRGYGFAAPGRATRRRRCRRCPPRPDERVRGRSRFLNCLPPDSTRLIFVVYLPPGVAGSGRLGGADVSGEDAGRHHDRPECRTRAMPDSGHAAAWRR